MSPRVGDGMSDFECSGAADAITFTPSMRSSSLEDAEVSNHDDGY
jgi:hypothetical protein